MRNLIKQYFLSTHKSVDSISVFKNDEPHSLLGVFKNDEPHSLWTVFLTQGKFPSVVAFRHDIDSDMISVIRDWGLDQILKNNN